MRLPWSSSGRSRMIGDMDFGLSSELREARTLFPATERLAYFNTAAVGLASRVLVNAYREYIDEWAASGPDYAGGVGAGLRGGGGGGRAGAGWGRGPAGGAPRRCCADCLGVVGGGLGGGAVR